MRYEILKLLKDNTPGYVSGEILSRRLGVSRTAVWKNIKQLISEGYEIDASTRSGYRFVSGSGIVNGFEIGYGLDLKFIGNKIYFLEKVDSTNNFAREKAAQGDESGTVVVSLNQTAGKGRMGRTWFSPANTGIYISVIFKPELPPGDIHFLTLAAAAAGLRAIRNCTGLAASVKWPNDIILNGKKVCGILAEMNSEPDRINYVVIGTGINYSQNPGEFPEEIRDKAVSLLGGAEENGIELSCGKLELIRSYLAELDYFYEKVLSEETKEVLELCKTNSATLGREVRIIEKGREYTGTAVDINPQGWLVVNLSDGTVKEVSSGEVSVRGLLGYSS